ncbi:PatB family C-S lyase [uncultured Endozoicomonas sp.]|uniref:MalY/PatB family protein n=1 Tax=uncultured Endozoicomonas sp. TaxID=432652 RepID=UPI0026074E5A|nr:PatB family C-S lyase [uncultured Endozoicomonas sp.]
MSIDFDNVIDRTNTSSLKWDRFASDVIPLWVADMDFKSAPEIIEALHERIDHGVFGYTMPDGELEQLVVERCRNLYHWDIEPEWIVWMPGLVSALNVCVRAYAGKREGVISPIPVYYPFLTAPKLANRELIGVEWIKSDGRWMLDLDGLEKKINSSTKLLMLCNPQNPNGRVFTRDELKALEQFCKKHNLIVCSDEVHCDLILDRHAEHIPYASISDYARDHSVTLMSPSKTFNLAGFGCAFTIIPDGKVRHQFNATRSGIVPSPDSTLIGYAATKAAYRHGEPWRQSLLDYLRGNHDYLMEQINSIPGLSMEPLQATYLAWIDVSELQLEDPHQFFEQAGVGLSPGKQFGDANYLRLNFGCSRSILEEAIGRIKTAIINR